MIIEDSEFNEVLRRAEEVYKENFSNETWFEKCVFLSWYCDVGDCKFCFRSTQKEKIQDPNLARRSMESVLAEVFLAKKLGWQLEFLTGGYRIYPFEELVSVVKRVKELYGEKIWVNLGALSIDELEKLRPYVKGVCGSIETVNRSVHKRVCPSKPIEGYMKMFDDAKGFEKSLAIVIGLGEKIEDIKDLFRLIENNNISKIDFYPLHPIKGTIFSKGPDSLYYASWIALTRIKFPEIKITAGTWVDRAAETGLLLKAGANSITKFPAIRMFNSEQARVIEEEAKNAGRKFLGTLTDVSYLDDIKADDRIKEKVENYIGVMRRSKS